MINVIADRYAQALFEVGEETQTTSELYQELSELVKILNENNDFYSFLKSPLISCEDKKTVMQNIFENQLSDSMNNFLKIVIDKDRMSVIEKIKEYIGSEKRVKMYLQVLGMAIGYTTYRGTKKAVVDDSKDKQKRTIKMFCPSCDFETKTSRKVFEKYGQKCPTCMCGAQMAVDLEDENDESENI